MEIGTRIKQLRTERHISQEALANALNISRQSVTKWENNASKPSTANILALCEFFDVPLNELMVADNVSQGTSEIEERSDTKVRFWEKIPLKCILIISGLLYMELHFICMCFVLLLLLLFWLACFCFLGQNT